MSEALFHGFLSGEQLETFLKFLTFSIHKTNKYFKIWNDSFFWMLFKDFSQFFGRKNIPFQKIFCRRQFFGYEKCAEMWGELASSCSSSLIFIINGLNFLLSCFSLILIFQLYVLGGNRFICKDDYLSCELFHYFIPLNNISCQKTGGRKNKGNEVKLIQGNKREFFWNSNSTNLSETLV